MPGLRNRLFVSLVATILCAPVSYVARRAIGASHLLDPLSDWLGGWMIVYATPQIEWAAASLLTFIAYAVSLFFIWRHFGRPALIISDGIALAHNIRDRVWKNDDDAADFWAWDRVSVLTLRQVAHLWSEERPTIHPAKMSQRAEIFLHELLDSGNSGELKIEPLLPPKNEFERWIRAFQVFSGLGPTAFADSHVTREILRAYALSRNERPLFLFPEDRCQATG